MWVCDECHRDTYGTSTFTVHPFGSRGRCEMCQTNVAECGDCHCRVAPRDKSDYVEPATRNRANEIVNKFKKPTTRSS